MKTNEFTLSFVDFVPATIESGILYISMKYRVVVHNCACGCNNKVVLTLSPATWQMLFDGKTVSIKGSVGNWTLPCQSHYWITKNKVDWARQWSEREIENGRASDRKALKTFYSTSKTHVSKKNFSFFK